MITLLTDFGTADYFVPAVKGVILTLHPPAHIVDLTHDIAPQDVWAGAFTLGACYRTFPRGTIHLAVVDPGVGSARRPIVVAAGGHLFVGPDNGLFSYVYAREAQTRVYHATRTEFFRPQPSATFHGRDVFAPLAAWLARGVHPASFGPEIDDYARFEIPQPLIESHTNVITGEVIHVDRYGNCITNLTEREWPRDAVPQSFQLGGQLGGQPVTQHGTHFAQAARKDDLFAYVGSAGYWEVALWCASAAERFGFARGTACQLVLARN